MRAAGLEHPGEFAVHREAEQAQDAVHGARQHRQVGVAAHDPVGGLVLGRLFLLGGGQYRPFRDVQAEDGQVLPRGAGSGQLAQVVALAAAGVEAGGGHFRSQVGQGDPGHGGGDGLVMAGVEVAPAGRHHFLAVPRVPGTLVLHRQEVGVALGGDVEIMAGGTAPGGAVALQRGAVQGAGQGLERGDAHGQVSREAMGRNMG